LSIVKSACLVAIHREFLGGFLASSESCELIRNDDTEKVKSGVKAPLSFFDSGYLNY
jgi:hypothetical protein